jgi:hypothetical protein
MEWTIADPVVDPNLLVIALGLKVAALITSAAALLGVVLAEVYAGRASRFARFILAACIVEGLPLLAWGVAAPEVGGVAGAGALLLALGLGAPAFFGTVESFSRLVDALMDAVDAKVRGATGPKGGARHTPGDARRVRDGGSGAGPDSAYPARILAGDANEGDS